MYRIGDHGRGRQHPNHSQQLRLVRSRYENLAILWLSTQIWRST